MSTTAPPRPVTPEDLLQMPDEGRGFELVDGELKELHMSKESTRIVCRICTRLENYCEARGAGYVFSEGASYRCFPDQPDRVRRADVSFISLSRMPSETYSDEGHCTTAPNLAVEVISPNDNAEDLEEKLAEWLAAGADVVWIVNPSTRTIRVHRADGGYAFLRARDTLTADGVLPGFACPVEEIFRRPSGPTPAA